MFTSTTFLHDSVPNRVLSGGERTVAFRTDDQWARNAKKPGKVTAIAGDILTVQYDDGEVESFSIGRYFKTEEERKRATYFIEHRHNSHVVEQLNVRSNIGVVTSVDQ